MQKKQYDVVIFGATSFVGQILCRYLLNEYGAGDGTDTKRNGRSLSWAIAGRSRSKLAALLKDLDAPALAIIEADAADEAALNALCAQTRVVVSTVGPYALYGETLMRVCAQTGTDYCDLTGEPAWVRRMIAQYADAAAKSGARIINCCGFDSIPSDLGVWFLQQQSLLHYGEPCVTVKMGVKAMRGAASGGTVASMVNAVKEATQNKELRRELVNPYSLCMMEAKPTIRQTNIKSPVFDADFNAWAAPFVMAAINVRIVLRSNALSGFAYTEKFKYHEAMLMGTGFKGRYKATALSAGLGGFVTAAAIPPTRWVMEKFILPAPGEGPSPAAQEKGFYDFRFIGHTADGRDLKVKVTGDRDPGYGSTAKILGEAAACLALDVPKNKLGGGFWTPSHALGQPLLDRLVRHAGLTFEVLE
jgi:short subunit dehydrogenase-like uncharacterized protein